mgnify:CR=1 FL=1|tara:strand:+ start:10878 stop:11888 length:1011 start_codon:yes stop_codon:yes gene_type:complete
MKNNNILILGSNEKFSLESMYIKAFKKLNYKVRIFHTYNISKDLKSRFIWKFLRFFIFESVRKKILNFIKNNKQKYDLIIIFKGLYLDEPFFSKLRNISNSKKIINIFPDDPFDVNYFKDISNKNILKCIPYFDHVFIYSKFLLKKLKKHYPKSRFSYLPFGYDSLIKKKKNKNNKKKFDLSFIGTADRERYNIIKQLSGFKIILAGNGWHKYDLSNNITLKDIITPDNFSKLYKKSNFSLNILRKQNKKSHNMKTFEIPANDGVMITYKNIEQNNFFPENKASIMYRDINDLKSKIDYFSRNLKKVNKIRENSKIIFKNHSYLERTKYLLKIIYE